MKRLILLTTCILTMLCVSMLPALAQQQQQQPHAQHTTKDSAAEDHGFGVREYTEFHDVLHPLQHEALPKNDFKTIRAKASELTTAGSAVMKLGVPKGVADAAQFKKAMRKFRSSLAKFKADAVSDGDAQLKTSYLAVHDSFESLAAMLPRK